MKFQKRYIISAAIVLALGAAVYVNWQFTSAPSVRSKELGAASYVNATPASTADEAKQTASLSRETTDYFSSERTKRQAAQDKVLDEAKEIFDMENANADDISEAQKNVEKILKNFTIQESCLCWISDEGVTVVVPESELNDATVLIADDAVISHYDVSYENISVVGA